MEKVPAPAVDYSMVWQSFSTILGFHLNWVKCSKWYLENHILKMVRSQCAYYSKHFLFLCSQMVVSEYKLWCCDWLIFQFPFLLICLASLQTCYPLCPTMSHYVKKGKIKCKVLQYQRLAYTMITDSTYFWVNIDMVAFSIL